MCIEFKAPEKVSNPNNWPSLFEAGAIDQGKSWNWQAVLTDTLSDIECIIMNPRRDDWDSSWEQSIDNPKFKEQVEWELKGLEDATFVVVCLTKGSKAPISLLELGLHVVGRRMIVFCPEGFYRKGNVDVVCQRYGVPVYDDFDEFCKNVKARMLETISGQHVLEVLPAGTMQQHQKHWVTASDRISHRLMAREFVIGMRYYDKPHLEIPQFPIQAADANMEYDRKLKEVRKLVNELEKLLWKHEARQGGRTNDWGFVGDLEHLEGQLTEMVRFIGGGTRG